MPLDFRAIDSDKGFLPHRSLRNASFLPRRGKMGVTCILLRGMPAFGVAMWLLLSADTAHARRGRVGYYTGGYGYLSPGLVHIPVGNDDAEDVLDLGYQWGAGVGALLSPGILYLGFGFGFEHDILNYEDRGYCDTFDCSGHVLRFLPELRAGVGIRRIAAYGMVAPGVALVFQEYERPFRDDRKDLEPAFNFAVGAGLQVLVTRHFAVGAELGCDLAFMFDDDDDSAIMFSELHTLDMKAMLTWYFR